MDKMMLELIQVEKTIHRKKLIRPTSFQLKYGHILALSGGNGAGKSTLIRLIAGINKPTKGKIIVDGMELNKNHRLFFNQIGYMPDDFQFQKNLTAGETLTFYAKLKKVKKERVEEVLEKVGLIDSMHKTMGTFSKGMKQRMLLAQAMLAKPPLLILDEPTNGLDPYWVHSFSQMMKEARTNGQTVILSTHDLNVAEEIADEVIFLYEGTVVNKGLISDFNKLGLYKTYQQIFLDMQKTS
ncbi:heme ABC exporter ATP-binding protein CcmA [Oceanobacillus halophilus]|uniref:Heme ABC exporter ATP-binding protein CcmA n=1 Tax=Oceanobacillus halophilus TaxID=930130 RepID=A0A495A1E8_9BACI|nr:heme ABC exporter ATP-binding protein CcmA [Oceanobacillus halophilus]RKQ33194.1 heme ABC exporter ATP-binding protein CcmA [Oceanobacillus halophilus]